MKPPASTLCTCRIQRYLTTFSTNVVSENSQFTFYTTLRLMSPLHLIKKKVCVACNPSKAHLTPVSPFSWLVIGTFKANLFFCVSSNFTTDIKYICNLETRYSLFMETDMLMLGSQHIRGIVMAVTAGVKIAQTKLKFI